MIQKGKVSSISNFSYIFSKFTEVKETQEMKMMISHDYRPIKRDNLQKKDLEDGVVLRDQKTSQVFTLNTTAALIWEYCDGNTSVEVIAQELATVCNTNQEDMLKDVIKVITDFQGQGLLKTEP